MVAMSFRIPIASAPGAGQVATPVDFVRGDVAALATHMQRCAHSRGRLFALRGGLQRVHAMAAGHIVTLVCIAAVLGAGLLSIY